MDPRIEAALARSIELGEYGIAVSAYHRGKKIVDAFAGKANKETDSPVTEKTIFPVFSVTKGVTTLAVHLQAERGLIDFTKPITSYWPEFKANWKEGITVEMALSHRSGIPQMPEGVTSERLADWEWMVKRVAQLKPIFAPGTANAYHVLVWGWILREVVRMTDPVHRPFDVFVYEEICKPIGIENFYLGVPGNELVRAAKLYGENSFALLDEHGIRPPSVFPGADVHNTKVIQQAVDPGAGAITDARSVTRIFALISNGGELDGVRLLSPERVAGLTRPRESPHNPDKILLIPKAPAVVDRPLPA